MHATDVTPPAKAAAVPVAMVSSSSRPGSRRWTCMSISPGQTILPAASIIRKPLHSTTSWSCTVVPLGSTVVSSVLPWSVFLPTQGELETDADHQQRGDDHDHA